MSIPNPTVGPSGFCLDRVHIMFYFYTMRRYRQYCGFHVISTLDRFIIHEGLIHKIPINNIFNCRLN